MADAAQRAWVQTIFGVTLGADSPGGAHSPGLNEAKTNDAAVSPRPKEAHTEGARVRLAKGLLIWNATRTNVAQEVTRLQQAILSDTVYEPDYEEIKANIGRLEAVLELLDDSLTKKLGELQAASDPVTKSTLSSEARQIVAEFQKRLAREALLNDIDDNGFIPLDIKPRVTQALSAVAEVI